MSKITHGLWLFLVIWCALWSAVFGYALGHDVAKRGCRTWVADGCGTYATVWTKTNGLDCESLGCVKMGDWISCECKRRVAP